MWRLLEKPGAFLCPLAVFVINKIEPTICQPFSRVPEGHSHLWQLTCRFFLTLYHTSRCVPLRWLLLQDAVHELHLMLVWTVCQSPDTSRDTQATAGPLPFVYL